MKCDWSTEQFYLSLAVVIGLGQSALLLRYILCADCYKWPKFTILYIGLTYIYI